MSRGCPKVGVAPTWTWWEYLRPMRPFCLLLLSLAIIARGAWAQQAPNPRSQVHRVSHAQTAPATTLPSPRLAIEPRGAGGGTLVHLTIDRLPRNVGTDGTVDSIASVTGTMADEALHFYPVTAADGSLEKLEALGAVPLDVSDSLVARVEVARASGAIDTLHVSLRYPHQAPSRPTTVATRPSRVSRSLTRALRRLHVDRQFTRPMDSATAARVDQENDLAREIGRKSQATPRLWTLSFLRPRDSKVTSRFGSGRLFNGRVQSSHLGIDYRGAMGEAIHAANRGVVALVANFFLAGNVVYIDHGDGIVTGYFHMSQPEVAVGDTVERGQEIGLVGATGRVTGPHLHWSARFGAITIDPGNLLRLKAPFVAGSTSAVSAASR